MKKSFIRKVYYISKFEVKRENIIIILRFVFIIGKIGKDEFGCLKNIY